MSNDAQTTYKILVQTKSGWEEKARTADMGEARRAADTFHAKKKFRSVKVDKEFTDSTNGRRVSATIIMKGSKPSSGMSVLWLLLLAAVCGIATFVITYVLTGGEI